MKPIEEEVFRAFCAFKQFDLPAFDAWLSTLQGHGAHIELTERRAQAWQALRADDDQQALRHLEWMLLRWRYIRRTDFLQPLAARAKPFIDHQGRSEGPIKVLIRRVLPGLERDLGRKARTLEVWRACAAKSGRSIKFIGTGSRATPGWHITVKGDPDGTSYTRFGKSISEVRSAKKGA